jgi:hypothetical protein
MLSARRWRAQTRGDIYELPLPYTVCVALDGAGYTTQAALAAAELGAIIRVCSKALEPRDAAALTLLHQWLHDPRHPRNQGTR